MGLNEAETILLTKWLLQSYSRPLNEGCDAPYMLILYGSQGCGKTSTLRILSKGWIVSLNNRNSNGKDGVILRHRGWFINNDELAALSKSDIEGLKAEITETVDTYRQPYSSVTTNLKRFSVFCGTTNNPHILKDDSGNRRFFVLHFRRKFTNEDRQWLEANIDRLWGYVKHLAESGITYHLTAEEMDSLTKMQQSYQLRSHTDDVLLGCILWFASNYPNKPLSAATIAQFMKEHRENVSSQKIGQRLTAMGFETKRQKVGKTMVRAITNLDHIHTFEDVAEYRCSYIPQIDTSIRDGIAEGCEW